MCVLFLASSTRGILHHKENEASEHGRSASGDPCLVDVRSCEGSLRCFGAKTAPTPSKHAIVFLATDGEIPTPDQVRGARQQPVICHVRTCDGLRVLSEVAPLSIGDAKRLCENQTGEYVANGHSEGEDGTLPRGHSSPEAKESTLTGGETDDGALGPPEAGNGPTQAPQGDSADDGGESPIQYPSSEVHEEEHDAASPTIVDRIHQEQNADGVTNDGDEANLCAGRNADCITVEHGYCEGGTCRCKEGYRVSPDNTKLCILAEVNAGDIVTEAPITTSTDTTTAMTTTTTTTTTETVMGSENDEEEGQSSGEERPHDREEEDAPVAVKIGEGG